MRRSKPSDFRTSKTQGIPTDPEVRMITEYDWDNDEMVTRPETQAEAKTRKQRQKDARKRAALSEIRRATWPWEKARTLAIEYAMRTNTVQDGFVEVNVPFDVTIRKDRWYRTERWTLIELYPTSIMTDKGPAVPTRLVRKRKASDKVHVQVVVDETLR
jgi:hypothetical protein